MVKVAAPALSLDASGSLAGAIVFSKWKGRPYVRELVKPSNPRSGGQVGVRAMFKFLAQIWQTLTTANQATWQTMADQLVASPFNGFMSRNQFRWRNWLGPTKEDPAAEAGAVATGNTCACVGGVRQITVNITPITAINQQWGMMIFRSVTTGFTTAFSNCVAIIKADALSLHSWIDTPLSAGTYYYNFRPFTTDGVMGAQVGQQTGTAT
jgi:hypothetical protein